MNHEHPEVMATWASELGIEPLAESWSVGFRISTVPMENWFYTRKALRPEDIMLELIVPSYGLWCADLSRHDRLFQVQWRPNNDLRAESQQLKYRKFIKWPSLSSLREFPYLVERIEQASGITFIRHVNVGTNEWVDLDRFITESSPKIQAWLSPCADTVGAYFKSPKPAGDC